MEKQNIKICVAFHCIYPIADCIKKYPDIYVPIHAGRALCKPDKHNVMLFNMLGDNTGKNISAFNRYLSEVTVLYWMGTHLEDLGNPEYIGLNHYHRFFRYGCFDNLTPNDIVVCKVSLMLPLHEQVQHFDKCAFELLDLGEKLFTEPDEKELFNAWVNGKDFYCCNMFIMHTKLFAYYTNWLHAIVDSIIPLLPFRESCNHAKRKWSFVIERLTGFYLYLLEHKYGYHLIKEWHTSGIDKI